MPNDAELFPSREDSRSGSVVMPSGEEEWLVEEIVDEQKRGRGTQYLVKWCRYGDEENRWVPKCELEQCEALDKWLQQKGQNENS
jgi:hypothetical protein